MLKPWYSRYGVPLAVVLVLWRKDTRHMTKWMVWLLVVLKVFICGCASMKATTEMVDYINPMIRAITGGGYGGHGLGKTFPGAATPFGMVQLSPDTITGGDNASGYSAHHETIEGFSFTHMSGTGWYGDLGNFQVIAATGERLLDREMVKSEYSHDQEITSAGYYMVDLKRYGITHDEIVGGGILELKMGPTPNMQWASSPEQRPSSLSISRKQESPLD